MLAVPFLRNMGENYVRDQAVCALRSQCIMEEEFPRWRRKLRKLVSVLVVLLSLPLENFPSSLHDLLGKSFLNRVEAFLDQFVQFSLCYKRQTLARFFKMKFETILF